MPIGRFDGWECGADALARPPVPNPLSAARARAFSSLASPAGGVVSAPGSEDR